MPLYENRDNAENKIAVKDEWRQSVVSGGGACVAAIADIIRKRRGDGGGGLILAFDGWYGVDWQAVVDGVQAAVVGEGATMRVENINQLYLSADQIAEYKVPFIGEDPAFGVVNTDGHIIDLMDSQKVQACKASLAEARKAGEVVLVFGYGAAIPELRDAYDVMFYFDKTRQPLLWQIWEGKLVPFAQDDPKADYFWKEYYYCDYYLLHRQKDYAIEQMDYYLEAIEFEGLKMLPRETYDGVMSTLVTYPVKEVKIYQPGPWGAYRYKDIGDVPGLECNAWNELAGPELSMLVDLGDGIVLNMPAMNLMQYADEFVGPYLNETYPGLFPMDVWLDDGYFPKPTPSERTSMPIHNHPSSDYVKQHFKEPIGRYETYYIAEAYQGANTWMGFFEDADLEVWEAKCRKSSAEMTPIEDWKEFIVNWKTNVGDLFLIPPGTTHGHGGNQMVLEMDTCPSIAGTEYSFFTYDFNRPSWDDETKTMTAPPMKMHLDHGFDNCKWVRENWVKDHLKPTAEIIKWTKEYSLDRYGSYGQMPFEIERLHFNERAEYDTEGKFVHVVTLTIGKRVMIRSKSNPELQTEIDWYQSALVPACFGEYEYVNMGEGACSVVLMRWKKG